MLTFPDWLRDERKRAGLSQVQLALVVRERDEESAVWQARVTAWENGKELPNFRQLALIAVALKLDIDAWREGVDLWQQVQLSDLPDHPASRVGFGEEPTVTCP